MFNLAVFASGNGSNAENIIRYFKSHNRAQVKLVATNKNSAKVITKSGKIRCSNDIVYKRRVRK